MAAEVGLSLEDVAPVAAVGHGATLSIPPGETAVLESAKLAYHELCHRQC